MFHKEGSCVDAISSSSSNSQGGGTKKNTKGGKGSHRSSHPVSATSKAVDVPLRKSDRRKLLQRAAAYFFPYSSNTEKDDEKLDDTSIGESSDSVTKQLLDEIFLKGGAISSRSLPLPKSFGTGTKSHHENIVLYLKMPNNQIDNDEDDEKISCWPYKNKSQFVWMALEDKKSGLILRETPTIALLAVVWHTIDASMATEMQARRVVWVPSAVSSYLCRGADLMRAGIIGAPSCVIRRDVQDQRSNENSVKSKKQQENRLEGGKDMVVICVHGNPQPFAVGRSVLLSKATDNQPSYGPGTKRIGVEIWSCYGDDLWRTTTTLAKGSNRKIKNTPPDRVGSNRLPFVDFEDGSYGNPGFSCNDDGKLCVLPLVEMSSEDGDECDGNVTGCDDEPQEECPTKVQQNHDGKDENATITNEEISIGIGTTSNDEESHPRAIESCVKELKEEETTVLQQPSPDDLLHEAVCCALVQLGKSDLPMPVGTFYTKYVVPYRPQNVDSMSALMKETTYKKFGNYIKRWRQQNGTTGDDDSFGLLKTGPDSSNRNNKDPNAMLLSYNKRHSDLRNFKRTRKPNNENGNAKSSKIVVVKLYVVPNAWTKLLRLEADEVNAIHASSTTRRGTGMLTLPEVRKILEGYIERESLGNDLSSTKRRNKVILDGPLTDVLYGKDSKESAPSELPRKNLNQRFVDRLTPAFGLVEMPGSTVLKLGHGKPPVVQIEVVRRQSKKFVTRLRGLENYYLDGIDPAAFCKEVSKRLAMSGSVDKDPAANGRAALARKGHVEFVFGANVVDELEALLTGDETLSDHGGTKGGDWSYPLIPYDVINAILRKGVPARKRRRP